MTRGIHWFRNDLRLRDNTALCDLLSRVGQWIPLFVVDPRLWDPAGAARQRFLRECLEALRRGLDAYDVPLVVRTGRPEAVLPALVRETGASRVAWNEDTTPFARARDARVRCALERAGARVLDRRDRVVFGTDAQPYFRIFNPTSQAERHDPEGRYVRAWVPELDGGGYPAPIVDHAERRGRALEWYRAARARSEARPERSR